MITFKQRMDYPEDEGDKSLRNSGKTTWSHNPEEHNPQILNLIALILLREEYRTGEQNGNNTDPNC